MTIDGAGFGTVDNTQLLFDQMPATLLSVTSNRMLSAIAPYALDGKTSSPFERKSNPAERCRIQCGWLVAPTSPGIYTVNGGGSGAGGGFLNQDGTPNSVSNPAAVGSTVTFYATGVGQTIPDPAWMAYFIEAGQWRLSRIPRCDLHRWPLHLRGRNILLDSAPGFPADVLHRATAVVPQPIYSSVPRPCTATNCGGRSTHRRARLTLPELIERFATSRSSSRINTKSRAETRPFGSLYRPSDISVMGSTTRSPFARHQRKSSALRKGTKMPGPPKPSAAAMIACQGRDWFRLLHARKTLPQSRIR